MKKILLFICIFLFLYFSILPCSAEEISFEDYIPNEYIEILEQNDIDIENGFSFQNLLKIIISSFNGNISEIKNILSYLILLLIMLSISKFVIKDNLSFGNENLLNKIMLVIFEISVLFIIKTPIINSISLISDYKYTIEIMAPIISAITLYGGNVILSSVESLGFSLFSTFVSFISLFFVKTFFILSILSAFMETVGNSNIHIFIKSLKKYLLIFQGFVLTFFSIVFSNQSIVSKTTESVGIKGAKTVISKMIPIYGQIIGESLKYAETSFEYIKTIVGSSFIWIVIILTLPTMICLILYKIVFLVLEFFTAVLNQNEETRIIQEISGIFDFLIGTLSFVMLFFIVFLSVFINISLSTGKL